MQNLFYRIKKHNFKFLDFQVFFFLFKKFSRNQEKLNNQNGLIDNKNLAFSTKCNNDKTDNLSV